MKKTFLIIIVSILPLLVCAQERFYSLYPGLAIFKSFENENGYRLYGVDTANYANSITPIYSSTYLNGEIGETIKYINDTIATFSFYTSGNFKILDNYVVIGGIYKENTKNYILNPILMYFDVSNYHLDSIRDFKEYFNQRSARFFLHEDNENTISFCGDVQISMDWEAKTFYGIYNRITDSFTHKEYAIPNHCQMTPYQLHPTQDGGYIISTEQDMTYLYPERVKACLVKTDAEGNEQWRYVIGPDSIATYRPRVFDAPDGNYYVVWTDPQRITSTLLQNNLSNTIRIAKLTDYGSYAELSNERDLYVDFGIAIRTYNVIYDCLQTDDGTMYLLLQSLSGYRSVLVKIFPNGRGAWLRSYRVFPENDPTYSETSLYGMSRTSDGGFMLTGEFSSDPGAMFPNGIQSALAIKVDSCGCLDAEGCNPHCGDSYLPQYIRMPQAEVYPNPAVDEIRIVLPNGNGSAGYNIKIYSTSGQLLMEENCLGSDYKSAQVGSSDYKSERAVGVGEFSVNISELPDGHYRVLVSGGGKVYGAGFVKVGW